MDVKIVFQQVYVLIVNKYGDLGTVAQMSGEFVEEDLLVVGQLVEQKQYVRTLVSVRSLCPVSG